MNAARRLRIAGLLDRLEAMRDDLREIDKEETIDWLAKMPENRTTADADAFDGLGEANHHFNELVAALTKAKDAGNG